MKKKILAGLFSLCMIANSIPMTNALMSMKVFADDNVRETIVNGYVTRASVVNSEGEYTDNSGSMVLSAKTDGLTDFKGFTCDWSVDEQAGLDLTIRFNENAVNPTVGFIEMEAVTFELGKALRFDEDFWLYQGIEDVSQTVTNIWLNDLDRDNSKVTKSLELEFRESDLNPGDLAVSIRLRPKKIKSRQVEYTELEIFGQKIRVKMRPEWWDEEKMANQLLESGTFRTNSTTKGDRTADIPIDYEYYAFDDGQLLFIADTVGAIDTNTLSDMLFNFSIPGYYDVEMWDLSDQYSMATYIPYNTGYVDTSIKYSLRPNHSTGSEEGRIFVLRFTPNGKYDDWSHGAHYTDGATYDSKLFVDDWVFEYPTEFHEDEWDEDGGYTEAVIYTDIYNEETGESKRVSNLKHYPLERTYSEEQSGEFKADYTINSIFFYENLGCRYEVDSETGELNIYVSNLTKREVETIDINIGTLIYNTDLYSHTLTTFGELGRESYGRSVGNTGFYSNIINLEHVRSLYANIREFPDGDIAKITLTPRNGRLEQDTVVTVLGHDILVKAGTGVSSKGKKLIECDVNNDGKVNAVDASEILMAAAQIGSGTPTSEIENIDKMDIDGDGKVNAVDASDILMLSAAVGSGTVIEYIDDFFGWR